MLYYLTHVNEEIIDVGYFPASDAALEGAMQKLRSAMGMEAESPATAPEAPTTDGAMTAPEVVPAEVTGNIIVAGSSTVYPLTERMAEIFGDEGYAGSITVDSIGSGAGFERFCNEAETDLSNASRPIKEEEIQACQANGRDPIEFRVGTDAIAVTVSAENTFVESLTMEELAAVFSTATTWADVNPEWPAEPIQRYIPGTDSGTFDFFVEAVFEEDKTPILATNPQMSEDDNMLVQGVQGSPYAIGFFGYAYYQENEDTLKALAIDGIAPTAETAEDNSYPLSRPLFVYSAPSVLEEKPQVASFMLYYLTHVNEEIIDVGYFPASDAALEGAMQKLRSAMGN
jgi:phosphate transport system substrate-binding protein